MTSTDTSTTATVLDISPVIPVVTVDNPSDGPDIARALLAGGVGIIEVTLRTAGAIDAVRAIADEVPEIALGVGSVLTTRQADEAIDAGAGFLVSPGASTGLLAHMVASPVAVLPGVATLSEVIVAMEHGLTDLKFFPAGPAGGPAYLSAIAGPIPQVRFCPTGGVGLHNMRDYLALPNVATVGGSWLVPARAQADRDWAAITELAAAAVAGAAAG